MSTVVYHTNQFSVSVKAKGAFANMLAEHNLSTKTPISETEHRSRTCQGDELWSNNTICTAHDVLGPKYQKDVNECHIHVFKGANSLAFNSDSM